MRWPLLQMGWVGAMGARAKAREERKGRGGYAMDAEESRSPFAITSWRGCSGPARRGLDHIRIAVKDFTVEAAARVVRELGIKMDDRAAPGTVRIADPDGMTIELAA